MLSAAAPKRRVMITMNPFLHEQIKRLHESLSGLIEQLLQKYLAEKKKAEIRKNLLAAAKDPERLKDDLEIAQDFFAAEL